MKKKTGKTNAAGRRLLQSLREIHDAVVTGDHGRLTASEVEIPDPPSGGLGLRFSFSVRILQA